MDKAHSKLLILIFLLLTGCASLNKSMLQKEQRVLLDPLMLRADYDIQDLRIDLIRNTESTDSVGDSDVPYHTLGFKLGNGLFYDLHGNIALMIPELFGLEKTDNFNILESNKKGKPVAQYVKSHDDFTIKNFGFLAGKKTIISEKHRDELWVKNGWSHFKIVDDDSTLTYKPFLGKTAIYPEPGGYFVKGFLKKEHFHQDGHAVSLGKDLKIINYGDRLEFNYRHWLGANKRYTFVKIGNALYFYGKHFHGIKIVLEGNRISVFHNKRLEKNYALKHNTSDDFSSDLH